MEFENLAIVYNGEIYNYKELKNELMQFGYKFLSDCDTEVVLHSYRKWGQDCVKRFNGMWAFCIYDKTKKTLFLSRDRFGTKPLYYYCDGKQFIFASGLKAIKETGSKLKINPAGLNYFFYQKYIGDNLTIFENCCKLRPSENLIFNLADKTLILTKYYNLAHEINKCQYTNLKNRLEAVESIITDSVEKRLIADVPVGSFLSGGIDSSLISAVISRKHKDFNTFSIGFKDPSYNELGFSKLVSEHIKTKHHYDYLTIDEETIKFIIENMDEPFGDSSIIPTYLLSKIARQKVTVCLSGDAADEIFAGYDTYRAFLLAEFTPAFLVKLLKPLINLLPVSDKKVTPAFKMKRFVNNFTLNANKRHLDWMATFDDTQRQKLLGNFFVDTEKIINLSSDQSFQSIQLNDISNYLAEDILKKVDLASMLNSLEVRVPFLDYRLVPLVLSLPLKYKINAFKTKIYLKKIARKYLPKKIIKRQKRGFTVPVSGWIKNSLFIQQVLTDKSYYRHNLLNFDFIQELLCSHLENKHDNARMLWLVFVFNYWLSKISL